MLADRAKDILFNAELVDLVFEHLPDALVIVDVSGIIQRMNTRAEILNGYRHVELIGQRIEMVPEAQRQPHETARHVYMESPHLRPLDLSLPLHIRRETGGVVPVNIALTPMVMSRGTWIIATVRPRR
jgi:PAS domain S-box-containing protein